MNWFLDLQPATQAAVVAAAVSLIVAFFNPLTSRRIERLKNELSEKLQHTKAALQTDLALTKAALDEQASAKNARQAYEFDARKRLYAELEPLLFQLFDASEGSYFRVKSLVRTQREGHLGGGENSWLSNDGYYLISTIYRIFLPLSIFRLIQKSATFVDLNLDQSIRTRYYLLRQAYLTFTDDFVMAKQSPELEYNPNKPYAVASGLVSML